MFSATVISVKRPSALRSSVTSATPAAIASPGLRNRPGRPSSVIVPVGGYGLAPKRASSSSVRPAPSSPATPSTSPAWTWNVTFASDGRPLKGGLGERQARDFEHRAGADRVRLVVHRGDLAPDHPAHDLRRGRSRRGSRWRRTGRRGARSRGRPG